MDVGSVYQRWIRPIDRGQFADRMVGAQIDNSSTFQAKQQLEKGVDRGEEAKEETEVG